MIQGVFFNWRSPKINKYGEKLKYQNWCPPKRYQFCWHLILDILVVDNGGYYVPVVATGGFSDAPGSIYRSILSSCSYCWKIFTTGASYLTTGTLCSGAKNHMGKKTDNLHFRGPIGVQAFTEAAISLLNSL